MGIEQVRKELGIKDDNTIGENTVNCIVYRFIKYEKRIKELERQNRWLEKLSIWLRNAHNKIKELECQNTENAQQKG